MDGSVPTELQGELLNIDQTISEGYYGPRQTINISDKGMTAGDRSFQFHTFESNGEGKWKFEPASPGGIFAEDPYGPGTIELKDGLIKVSVTQGPGTISYGAESEYESFTGTFTKGGETKLDQTLAGVWLNASNAATCRKMTVTVISDAVSFAAGVGSAVVDGIRKEDAVNCAATAKLLWTKQEGAVTKAYFKSVDDDRNGKFGTSELTLTLSGEQLVLSAGKLSATLSRPVVEKPKPKGLEEIPESLRGRYKLVKPSDPKEKNYTCKNATMIISSRKVMTTGGKHANCAGSWDISAVVPDDPIYTFRWLDPKARKEKEKEKEFTVTNMDGSLAISGLLRFFPRVRLEGTWVSAAALATPKKKKRRGKSKRRRGRRR